MIIRNDTKSDNCPICGKTGNLVKIFTVRYIVAQELSGQVGNSDYYLCMNENCDVAYYNNDHGTVSNIYQVKVPIWFKKAQSLNMRVIAVR